MLKVCRYDSGGAKQRVLRKHGEEVVRPVKKMAIVLAAGRGKRMKSKLPKVLHPVCGRPMVEHVLQAVKEAGCERAVVVIGQGAQEVQAALGDAAEYALQPEPLGTGHAVMQAEPLLAGEDGVALVVCGDTPLITAHTIEAMFALHRESGAAATVLTALVDDPAGYGRVVRGAAGDVERIVEDKDCGPEERAIREINAGAYCFDTRRLFAALKRLTADNAQGEYYLTDVIGILRGEGETVAACRTPDPDEIEGVNDRAALARAEKLMRRRILAGHMAGGVTVVDPDHTYIDASVRIGEDTVIYPGTHLRGETVIGRDCTIGPGCELTDTTVGDGTAMRHTVAEGAVIGSGCNVGPFAYLRPGTRIGDHVRVGDFVEIKNSVIGDHSKVPHLSYVGDATVGSRVNIGCGVITANYDGHNKFRTEIGDGAFIGSNSNLVAPVKIGRDAYVVAGSTITHDVGDGDVAIARERQVNKPGYAEKLRARALSRKNQAISQSHINNR